MNESLQARLERLEMLYTEQEHTIQALNDIVAGQDQAIARLHANLEQLKLQLGELKTDLAPESGAQFEKPPHY